MSRSVAREITSFCKKEIDLLFKHAKSFVKKKGLDIRLAPKVSLYGKILVVIPRKSGTAPKRNRLKRQLKSIFYEERLFQKEFDWIVLARKEALEIPFSEIRSLILGAYNTAKTKS